MFDSVFADSNGISELDSFFSGSCAVSLSGMASSEFRLVVPSPFELDDVSTFCVKPSEQDFSSCLQKQLPNTLFCGKATIFGLQNIHSSTSTCKDGMNLLNRFSSINI